MSSLKYEFKLLDAQEFGTHLLEQLGLDANRVTSVDIHVGHSVVEVTVHGFADERFEGIDFSALKLIMIQHIP